MLSLISFLFSTDTGVRTRPSRRTKEAATVYLELISHKLAKESKPKSHSQVEEIGDDDDDDAVSVSSIMDLKDLAKSSKCCHVKSLRGKLFWLLSLNEIPLN